MEKLTSVFPRALEIALLNGKKAIVGPMTIATACWLEEESEGGLQAFMDAMATAPMKNLRQITRFLFELVENKGDFADVEDFMRHVPIATIGDIVAVIMGSVDASLPETSGGEAAAGGKKSRGAK